LIWLVLAVLSSFAFGQLFKWSQRRGFYAPVVVTTNYLVVATMLSIVLVLGDGFRMDRQVLFVGCVSGVMFITSMLTWTWALTVSNVATALMAFRLSMLIPIVIGGVLWDEEAVSGPQWVGIAMALCALLLMSMSGRGGTHRISRARQALIAFAVFMAQGAVQLCNRWVRPAGLDDRHLEVLVTVTATAAVIGAIAVLLVRRRPGRERCVSLPALRMGAGIGLFNGVALVIMLVALSRFDGAQYFPINGCAVVIMDCLFAHFLWKERLSALAVAGAAMGGGSMFLVL
jgi:drug/metabolite transporter (DMT)-like permease